MRKADLLTAEQVVGLVAALCDHYDKAPPSVTFDLPTMFKEDGRTTVLGRYFLAERRIAFPADQVLFEVPVVAHEVAHHLGHAALLEGGGEAHGHGHADLTAEVERLARAIVAEGRP